MLGYCTEFSEGTCWPRVQGSKIPRYLKMRVLSFFRRLVTRTQQHCVHNTRPRTSYETTEAIQKAVRQCLRMAETAGEFSNFQNAGRNVYKEVAIMWKNKESYVHEGGVFGLSIIKHVTLQKNVAHDFRYDPRISHHIFWKLWQVPEWGYESVNMWVRSEKSGEAWIYTPWTTNIHHSFQASSLFSFLYSISLIVIIDKLN